MPIRKHSILGFSSPRSASDPQYILVKLDIGRDKMSKLNFRILELGILLGPLDFPFLKFLIIVCVPSLFVGYK